MEVTSRTNAESLVITFFERVWHPPHELDAIDELMTEGFTITTAGKTIYGRAEFKQWVSHFQSLLLDATTESIDTFQNQEQSKVVSRWVCSGKNNGLFGLKADNRPIKFTGIAIWHLKKDRFSECWVERSAYELYLTLAADSKMHAIT